MLTTISALVNTIVWLILAKINYYYSKKHNSIINEKFCKIQICISICSFIIFIISLFSNFYWLRFIGAMVLIIGDVCLFITMKRVSNMEDIFNRLNE